MARKKQFGVPAELSKGFADTIAIIENNEGKYKSTTLAIDTIKLDPLNPRRLNFTVDDAKNGISTEDPKYKVKIAEQIKLLELAETIKTSGVINPIIVFKNEDLYQVVAGERRYLASILAGKKDIEVRLFKTKPKAYTLKLLQWVENTSREDLTLFERVENIRDVFNEYKKTNPGVSLSTGLLENITGLANSTASLYNSVLNCSQTILVEIQNGSLNSLDKAVLISNISDQNIQEKALMFCKEGASLKSLRRFIKNELANKKQPLQKVTQKKSAGRKATKVNFGTTDSLKVATKLVDILLRSDELKHLAIKLDNAEMKDMSDASKTFKKLLELLEKEVTA